MRKPLNAAQCLALDAPGVWWVDRQLYLRVRSAGARVWIFRWMQHGRQSWKCLGSTRDVSLKEARARAVKLRAALLDGQDVRRLRSGFSFKDCGDQYVIDHKAGWSNDKHKYQWTQTLENYAYPHIGRVPVAEITVEHVLTVLKPIWNTKPETATRVRGRIERVLDWARAKGYRKGAENPARWQGALSHLLPPISRVQKVEHHAAISAEALPALVEKLAGRTEISAASLLFTILTAARSSEVLCAVWDEVELDAAVWTVPANRMKAKRPHRVPLSDAAKAVLVAVPHREGLIFPGAKKGRPQSLGTMIKILRTLCTDETVTVHGCRSTFRDWASSHGYSSELAERALAHAVKNKTEAAYLRTDLLEARRPMMNAWADYCYGTVEAPAKIEAKDQTPAELAFARLAAKMEADDASKKAVAAVAVKALNRMFR